jgi:hypothetical protein
MREDRPPARSEDIFTVSEGCDENAEGGDDPEQTDNDQC